MYVSDRGVRHSIEHLSVMGYLIETTMGLDWGYRVDVGAEMPPLVSDNVQALVIATALREASAFGVDIGEAAVRNLVTIRQVLTSWLRHPLDPAEVTTVRGAEDSPAATVSLDVLRRLAHVVRDSVTVRFDHLPSGEDARSLGGSSRVTS